MATAAEIVVQAYREGNLISLNTPLTPEQAAEGLLLLNNYMSSLLGFELGEFSTDWPVPPAETSPVAARFPLFPLSEKLPNDVWPYPPQNVRIILSLTADTTIYMPSRPNDGARFLFINIAGAGAETLTVDGNGRLVKGAATLVETPTVLNQQQLLYRADLGDWVSVTTLAADDASPLPLVYDDLLAIGTFVRLASRLGRSLTPELALTRGTLLKRLRTQYRQDMAQPGASPQPFLYPAADHDFSGRLRGNLF